MKTTIKRNKTSKIVILISHSTTAAAFDWLLNAKFTENELEIKK